MLQCNNRRQTQADRQATTGRQAVEHRITHTHTHKKMDAVMQVHAGTHIWGMRIDVFV